MNELQFCKRCLYGSDHPLGLVIDDEGICSGCRIHEEKDRLDWRERWDRLEKLVRPYRSVGKARYDCIIPVTGGQDSYYIVHTVKNRLRLHPLLVAYNKHFNTPLGIRNLANLRVRFNCDIVMQNVGLETVKKVTRSTFSRFGSMYWPILAGHTVFPVQVAVRYKIPLIIWGAHQGLEQVGMFSHEHEVEMTRRYRKDHDLFGIEADDLLSVFDTLKQEDVWQYRYPDDQQLNEVGVRGIYIGNYVRWDPKAQHEEMVSLYDYMGASFARTFDTYDYVDCFNYMDFHDVLKLYKHGYSKVTDHACREIRHGRLARAQAAALVRFHEHQKPRYIGQFGEWMGVPEESLRFLLDRARNPRYWHKDDREGWVFQGWSAQRDPRPDGLRQAGSHLHPKAIFAAQSTLEHDRDSGYIVIGKGYPEYNY
jgi:N-acetyl sugar amidotransferase